MWDFHCSWQNSPEAIERNAESFRWFGVFDEKNIAGYCIIDPISGDIPQLAIARAYRRQRIGFILLREAIRHNQYGSVQVINTEATCEAITAFLESAGIPLKGTQYEMMRRV